MLRGSFQFAAARLCSHVLANFGMAVELLLAAAHGQGVEVSHAVRLAMSGHARKARAPAGQGQGVAAMARLQEIAMFGHHGLAMFGEAGLAKAWAPPHLLQLAGLGLAQRLVLVSLCLWHTRDLVLGLLSAWPDLQVRLAEVAAHNLVLRLLLA